MIMEKKQVISVAGAGGKTTYIKNMAHQYVLHGKKVLITTTTHMAWPTIGCDDSLELIQKHLEENNWALAGRPVLHRSAKKMAGPEEWVLEKVIDLADVVLIEADGARKLPFKVPKPWEPVIHPATTKVVIMAGLEAAGQPIRNCCYNWESLCDILKKQPDESLTREDMKTAIQKTYLPALDRMGIQVPVELVFIGAQSGWNYETEILRNRILSTEESNVIMFDRI